MNDKRHKKSSKETESTSKGQPATSEDEWIIFDDKNFKVLKPNQTELVMSPLNYILYMVREDFQEIIDARAQFSEEEHPDLLKTFDGDKERTKEDKSGWEVGPDKSSKMASEKERQNFSVSSKQFYSPAPLSSSLFSKYDESYLASWNKVYFFAPDRPFKKQR